MLGVLASERGYTLRQMARLTGASYEACRHWRSGAHYPRAEHWQPLQDLFGLPVHELMAPATSSGDSPEAIAA